MFFGLTYDNILSLMPTLASDEIKIIRVIEDAEKPEKLTYSEDALQAKYSTVQSRIITSLHLRSELTGCGFQAVALWDTGSVSCGISPEARENLGLVATNAKERITVSDPYKRFVADVYEVTLDFGGKKVLRNIRAVEYPQLECQGVDFLIGMDVISRGCFSIDNSSRTVFTQRWN